MEKLKLSKVEVESAKFRPHVITYSTVDTIVDIFNNSPKSKMDVGIKKMSCVYDPYNFIEKKKCMERESGTHMKIKVRYDYDDEDIRTLRMIYVIYALTEYLELVKIEIEGTATDYNYKEKPIPIINLMKSIGKLVNNMISASDLYAFIDSNLQVPEDYEFMLNDKSKTRKFDQPPRTWYAITIRVEPRTTQLIICNKWRKNDNE